MADTAVLKPKWQLILGLVPSFNSAITGLVSLAIGVGGTLATQKLTAPRIEIPAADKPAAPLHKQIDLAVNRIDGRLTEILGVCGTGVDEIQALRTDWKAPRAARAKAVPAK